MTTGDMIAEVQGALGNRSDFLSPNVGYNRIISWLNWSQYELCGFHKERILSPRRFHCLEDDVTLSTTVIAQLVAQGTPADLSAVFINGGNNAVDFYKGWVVSTTGYQAGLTPPAGILGQTRVIRSYDGSPSLLAHVWPLWNVAPDAFTTITLYKRIYSFVSDLNLDPNLTIWSVERMEKVDDGTEIVQRPWVDLVGLDPKVINQPGFFARRNANLWFDNTPDQQYYFRVYFYKFPPKLSSASLAATPIFPEYWHQVIVEGAVWMGYSKLMEPLRAAEKKQEWIDMAGNKQDEFTIEAKHERRGAVMRFRR